MEYWCNRGYCYGMFVFVGVVAMECLFLLGLLLWNVWEKSNMVFLTNHTGFNHTNNCFGDRNPYSLSKRPYLTFPKHSIAITPIKTNIPWQQPQQKQTFRSNNSKCACNKHSIAITPTKTNIPQR